MRVKKKEASGRTRQPPKALIKAYEAASILRYSALLSINILAGGAL